MAKGTNFFDLFGNHNLPRQSGFDITLLPMNLSEGRNIGDLSGLFLFTAPKKTENSRLADIFIVLIHVENMEIADEMLHAWANELAEAYFIARGSLTMGVSSAVKQLSSHLAKDKKLSVFPTIYLNISVLRDRSLLLAHSGPVHSTIISSDHVQNFSNETCLPLQPDNNDLSFFTADVHSEDIILLCPHVPNDWTNAAIMEVTGNSPLNAIRFLLDRSGGNLQAAVIQLKTGKGQITYRKKSTITANVKPAFEEKAEKYSGPGTRRRSSDTKSSDSETLTSNPGEPEKPLYRQKKSSEFFNEFGTAEKESTPTESEKMPLNTAEDIKDASESTEPPLTGERELPGSNDVPYDFSAKETPQEKSDTEEIKIRRKVIRAVPNNENPNKNKKKRKLNFSRLAIILICGLLIPIIVVSALFFVYSGRSKNKLHEEYLTKAIETAQNAMLDTDQRTREAKWMEVISYTEQAMTYGNSPAARDILRNAMQQVDSINGGITTVYNYANAAKLPQNLNITEFAAAGQFTYALDSTSGSVLRFVPSGNGLALDTTFSCTPGNYNELGKENSSIKVGALLDFVLLPPGNPHGFVAAGIDADANVLYCSGFKTNQAGKLQKPNMEKFTIKAASFYDNALYILDTQASAVWEFIFSNADGFNFEPSNYYGSYSPYLTDTIDFTIYKEYGYFLRANGAILFCDYTGYKPDCTDIVYLKSQDGTSQIDLNLHQFSKIMINNSPDNSIYIMDPKLQSILNISVKGNFIRCIVPNRSGEEISQFSRATAFGITGQNRLLWGYRNNLYIGNMP